MNKGKLRTNRGITLVALVITIVVILIVAGTTVYTSLDRFEINGYNKMKNDLELLSDKVANYYLKYNGLPIKEKYTSALDFDKNVNDNENYYILDLEAMEGISLNYGKEGFNNPNASDDIYIINEKSHTIYYVKGIEVDRKMYYTIPENENSINDTIPPTKPEIKIISGDLNSDGKYTSDVEIEIIPGKDNWSGVYETTCSITKNGGEMSQEDIEKLKQNGLYVISDNATYVITVITKDNSENSSEVSKTIVVNIPENIS